MEHQELFVAIYHRLERAIGKPLGPVHTIQGNTQAFMRLIVLLDDNTSVFAKIATDSRSGDWLRHEQKIYGAVSNPHVANCLAWDDDGVYPILILEDLSHAYWPPPWTDKYINQVVAGLRDISSTSVAGLTRIEDNPKLNRGWLTVAEQPETFLKLGLATDVWLKAALPELLQIDGRQVLRGEALLHLDIRSDNLCFVDGRVMFLDWNWASLGNPLFDLGAWLPSLEAEGGPQPETILPNGGEIAAILSGYFAAQAGLPPPQNAQRVRQLQLVQLRSALPWTVRALNLPPLDGVQI